MASVASRVAGQCCSPWALKLGSDDVSNSRRNCSKSGFCPYPANSGRHQNVSGENWLNTFNLTLMAAVRATRAAIPYLLDRGAGNVVTIASVNAFLPDPGVIDYSSTKAAVWNLSKSLSKDYGPQGLRFNTISPGPVSTPLWLGEAGVAATIAKSNGISFDEARERIIASGGGFSTGRFTEPEEVADLVLLPASNRAGNVTGADFLIDGGLTKDL